MNSNCSRSSSSNSNGGPFVRLAPCVRVERSTLFVLVLLAVVPITVSWTSTTTIHSFKKRTARTTLLPLSSQFDATSATSSTTPNIGINNNLPVLHHSALKTRNITTAIQFYSLLGYTVEGKFRSGPARAAWLALDDTHRLELIEVPSYILNEPTGTVTRAVDYMKHPDCLGYNHVALDVTNVILSNPNMKHLQDWINDLNEKSVAMFGKTVRVALPPLQKLIGRAVYELAFMYDADGCLIELLNFQKELEQEMESGWEPWDGKLFQADNTNTNDLRANGKD
jgi:hypothetical protein